jgi:hypothetical protein
MNILVILTLSTASLRAWACSDISAKSSEIQHVVAIPRRTAEATGQLRHQAMLDVPAHAEAAPEDFDFYLSAHAQALPVASGTTLTPWLELRPIEDGLQQMLSGTMTPAPRPAAGTLNPCTWSSGGAAALDRLPMSSGLERLAARQRAGS